MEIKKTTESNQEFNSKTYTDILKENYENKSLKDSNSRLQFENKNLKDQIEAMTRNRELDNAKFVEEVTADIKKNIEEDIKKRIKSQPIPNLSITKEIMINIPKTYSMNPNTARYRPDNTQDVEKSFFRTKSSIEEKKNSFREEIEYIQYESDLKIKNLKQIILSLETENAELQSKIKEIKDFQSGNLEADSILFNSPRKYNQSPQTKKMFEGNSIMSDAYFELKEENETLKTRNIELENNLEYLKAIQEKIWVYSEDNLPFIANHSKRIHNIFVQHKELMTRKENEFLAILKKSQAVVEQETMRLSEAYKYVLIGLVAILLIITFYSKAL